MGDWLRTLTPDEARRVLACRHKVFLLYEGERTPHRSCGIAMAETFGLPTAPYQALRRGGITGCGECGVVVGARLVLGQILGDPDPTGSVTEVLRTAMEEFEARWPDRLGPRDRRIVCRDLTARFASFAGPDRASFCTALATEAATLVAEVLIRNGVPVDPTPIEGVPAAVFDPAAPADPLTA